MKFSRLFLIGLLAVLTLVLVQLPGATWGMTGNPIVTTASVDYSRLVAVLIEALKEQQDEIDQLKTKVSKLESIR